MSGGCLAGPSDDEAIELAFSKKKIEERKAWLAGFEPGTYLDQSVDQISYSDFVNKVRDDYVSVCIDDFSHISSFFSPFSQGVAPVTLCPHAMGHCRLLTALC